MNDQLTYPTPKKEPFTLNLHNNQRIDNYYWMRNRENPELLDYLKRENEYMETVLKPTKKLQKSLYNEMRARIKEDDSSAPYFKNGFWYYSRYEEGKEQEMFCRRKGTLAAKEEILIDENIEAINHPYYEIVAYSISKDNRIMAFTEDTTGRRLYQIRFKNLETGEILPHLITGTGSDLAWHNDNDTLYYSVKDEETLRPYLIQSFELFNSITKNVYEEKDETFVVNLDKSRDYKYIFIGCHSTLTTEFFFKSASDSSIFVSFLSRKENHEYFPESANGKFYVKSNLESKNFKLVSCLFENRDPKNWTIIQPHDSSILIEDFEVFDTHIVVQEKVRGLTQLRVYDADNLSNRIIPPSEQTYLLYLENNPESKSKTVRIGYSSMTTPHSIYDIDLNTFERKLIKQTVVIGDFDPNLYKSERVWAIAKDGVKVPVSLVYRKDTFQKDGSNPLLVYAYGAYGATVDPYFSSIRLSLLDRGFVYAIAHVRGGEYLGTAWYEDGKLLKKKNTFTDFITASEFLIDQKYCSKSHVFAMGGSAGGLLMGAISNMRPDLWRGIVAQVPFMDVVSTMLDDTIPLTTGEYDEWGNPNNPIYYEYMLSYSPYDQISVQNYPKMLVTSGLHDSQVQYWEPTKYVSKLRELKSDNNEILLKTNMDAGHSGASGRYEQLKEVALEYAFILWANDSIAT